MVEQQPSKLNTRVRFPSPAPAFHSNADYRVVDGLPESAYAMGIVLNRIPEKRSGTMTTCAASSSESE
jgi:hypothetical protein